MKKLLLILFVIVSLNLDAQYVTNYAKNVKQTEVDGVFYYLPRNIVRVDFIVEKNQSYKGKYSSFAKEMLNTDTYIKENKTTYRITKVNVSTLTEADPNMVFHIATDDKAKELPKYELAFNNEGIIKSFGYQSIENDTSNTNQDMETVLDYNQPTEFQYIPLEEDDVDDEEDVKTKLTDKEVALTIVEEIKKVRVAYFDLITGYQEVNYGKTINYMLDELKNLENEYLSMFVGKTTTETLTKTFYVIPEEGKTSIVLSKFSDTEGFNAKTGESVKINFTDNSSTSAINELTIDEIENTTYNNKLFYRNPANVTMQVFCGDDVVLENRLKISQLGNVILVPINKMRLTFDTNTGQLLSIIKE